MGTNRLVEEMPRMGGEGVVGRRVGWMHCDGIREFLGTMSFS